MIHSVLLLVYNPISLDTKYQASATTDLAVYKSIYSLCNNNSRTYSSMKYNEKYLQVDMEIESKELILFVRVR